VIRRGVLGVIALAACGNRHHDSAAKGNDDAAASARPAALPTVPESLPPTSPRDGITPEAVARGAELFRDPTLAVDHKTSCATCHDPAHGFSGNGRQNTAEGQPNLRRAQPLVNLAWKHEYGWDGRYATLDEQLAAHARGQLGAVPASPADVLAALRAFVLTRYSGDAPWDRVERSPSAPADLKAGYALFTGKAQCGVCHTPPLYTDLGYHRLGLIAVADEGRGRVDPSLRGAFATPTLRGAAARATFFHDGSAHSLDEAIDWHLAGGAGQGADPSIVDIKKIALAPDERAQLGAFVRALTETTK